MEKGEDEKGNMMVDWRENKLNGLRIKGRSRANGTIPRKERRGRIKGRDEGTHVNMIIVNSNFRAEGANG